MIGSGAHAQGNVAKILRHVRSSKSKVDTTRDKRVFWHISPEKISNLISILYAFAEQETLILQRDLPDRPSPLSFLPVLLRSN